jgi:hypothetical protein
MYLYSGRNLILPKRNEDTLIYHRRMPFLPIPPRSHQSASRLSEANEAVSKRAEAHPMNHRPVRACFSSRQCHWS